MPVGSATLAWVDEKTSDDAGRKIIERDHGRVLAELSREGKALPRCSRVRRRAERRFFFVRPPIAAENTQGSRLAAAAHGPQRELGLGEQIDAAGRGKGHGDAGGEREGLRRERPVRQRNLHAFHRGADPLRDRLGIVSGDIMEDEGKLVCADTGDEIVFLHGFAEFRCKLLQRFFDGCGAMAFAHLAQALDGDERQRRRPCRLAVVIKCGELGGKGDTVGQAGDGGRGSPPCASSRSGCRSRRVASRFRSSQQQKPSPHARTRQPHRAGAPPHRRNRTCRRPDRFPDVT